MLEGWLGSVVPHAVSPAVIDVVLSKPPVIGTNGKESDIA